MIKINLIGDRRPAVARRSKPKLALGGQNLSLVLIATFSILGILIAAGWWWMLNSSLEEEQAKVSRAKDEVKQLQKILDEVESFKAKQADLATRITVIKDLTLAQRGPVAVMDGVSRALPEQLWLNTMVIDKASVTVTGQAMNMNAIASFIENLSQVPEFKEPDTRNVEQVLGKAQVYFKFSLTFPFSLKPPVVEADKGAAGVEDGSAAGTTPARPAS